MNIFKFPSIEQYRNVVQHVQRRSSFEGIDENGNAIINPNKGKPSLKFRGTTKIHGCVSKGTLITLADGSKEPIENITQGTSIISYNEELKCVEYDIVDEVVIQELDKPWCQLNFDDGSILKCTQDHPILTTDGWIAAIDLLPTHTIIQN